MVYTNLVYTIGVCIYTYFSFLIEQEKINKIELERIQGPGQSVYQRMSACVAKVAEFRIIGMHLENSEVINEYLNESPLRHWNNTSIGARHNLFACYRWLLCSARAGMARSSSSF